jgi:inositol phosphorylceramide mannosyltransferase catalytic subunit
MQIPCIVYQTHKNQEYIKSNIELSRAVTSWKQYYQTEFYDDAQCDTFIREEFPEFYEQYQRLPLKVMKADIWRYCIIYKYGGIYADTDTVCLTNPSILLQDAELVIVPEESSFFCQWVFSAPAGSPFLKSVLDVFMERMKETPVIKGEHIVHHLTGPAAFTEGILRCLEKKGLPKYSHVHDYIGYPDPSLYVLPFEFHHNTVQHLFAGDSGWKVERDNMLKE